MGDAWVTQFGLGLTWPLHDIVITNIARCMPSKREVEGGSYIDQ